MKQTTIPMKIDTKVVLAMRRDLYLEGISEAQFTAVAEDADTLRIKEENGVFYVRCDSDCKIQLPDTASVTIERVDGEADVRELKNRLIVGKIGGDFNLQSAGSASIEMVGGDCALRSSSGMVEIARVGGDLLIEQASQTLVGNVGGDLEVDSVGGKFDSKVGGDVKLRLTDSRLAPIRITAGGDISVMLPADANAQLNLTAGGEISIHARNYHEEFEGAARNVILGEGGALVDLKAGGDIEITDEELPGFNFGNVFNNFDQNWDEFSDEIEKRISRGVSHALRSADMATRRAEKATQRAQDRINASLEKIQGSENPSGRSSLFANISFEKSAEPEAPEKNVISEEERILVLKMLAEKKISVEEAEKLLKALGG